MTRILTARWVLPIDRPPFQGGWIEIEDGFVQRTGAGPAPQGAEDLGDVAILPALVNAHTHLELSWLAGRVPPAGSFLTWVRTLIAERRRATPESEAQALAAMREAAAEARATGTVLVGDVSNTCTTFQVLREHGLGGVVFHEVLGFNIADTVAKVRDAWDLVDRCMTEIAALSQEDSARPPIAATVCAHAPYSVSRRLFDEIVSRRREIPMTIHAGESQEEMEFLRTGEGAFRDFLEEMDANDPEWEAPRCDPVEYLQRLGYLRADGLVVHGVHLSADALAALRSEDAVLVTCPRSNVWVGAGVPPVTRFYAEGLRVAIGTDSLASVSSLNMFDELAELRRIAPEVSAARLLESATKIGADALGFGNEYGTIAAGKRAVFAVVDVPDDVPDVEEYLVSGVPSARVRPLTC